MAARKPWTQTDRNERAQAAGFKNYHFYRKQLGTKEAQALIRKTERASGRTLRGPMRYKLVDLSRLKVGSSGRQGTLRYPDTWFDARQFLTSARGTESDWKQFRAAYRSTKSGTPRRR